MKLVHLAIEWFPGCIDRNPDVIDTLPLIPQFDFPIRTPRSPSI
jgi:hypothetical protein